MKELIQQSFFKIVNEEIPNLLNVLKKNKKVININQSSAYVDIDVFRMIKYSFEELVYVAGKRSVTFLQRLRPDYEWLIPLL